MSGTPIPKNKTDKKKEFVLHTVGADKTPCSEEYYIFDEHKGWQPASPSEGEAWEKSTVNYRIVHHDTMPKFRKSGLIGREKIYLVSDNGPDFVPPEESKEQPENN